jgi:hypothetical protein
MTEQKTIAEIHIKELSLRTGYSPMHIQSLIEQLMIMGWRPPANIPIDACGAGDVGFVAHGLGGK